MAENKKEKDRLERIEEMERELDEISGGKAVSYASDDLPSEMHEKFLQSVLAFEKGEFTTLFDKLESGGFVLPRPEELDDAQISRKLGELFDALSLLRVELHNTDHLGDRELYEHLWHDSLREESVFPDTPDFSYHIDLIGGGSDEDIQIHLKYYADDQEREKWAADWPDDDIPEKEPKPYDRDRTLPKIDYWGEG
jgi:hypothetical protein